MINAGVLLLLPNILEGLTMSGWYAALIVIIVLGLVNAIIRPFIILITLPVNVLTLGLFTFVINGLLFWFVSTVIKGFSVDGFATAFWGAFILSCISFLVSTLLSKDCK
jgi:putative membrane protein